MSEIDDILKFDPSIKKTSTEDVNKILAFDPAKEMANPTETLPSHQPSIPDEMGASHGQDDISWVEALKSAAMNAPESAFKYGSNIFKSISQMVQNPVESAKAIGNIVVGAGEVVAGLPIDTPVGESVEKIGGKEIMASGLEKLKPITDDLKMRYGSVERFKKELAENPVEILADISSVLMPAARATGSTKFLNIAQKMEPINLAMRVASKPFKLLPEKVPEHLYKSAVKFGTTLSDSERTAVTKTALKASNQIMPTENGLRKLREKINSYNEVITQKINESAQNGRIIPTGDLFKGLDDIKDSMKRITDQPIEVETAFNRIKKEWREMVAGIPEGYKRTPVEVQKFKQKIYKDLESFYEKQKATPAKVELRKAIASNARETLENIIPEIKQLNKSEGALIELWDALESKANRITNRDLIGIGLPVKMGTGAGIGYMFAGETGSAVGSALGLTLGVFDTPQVKAKIALVLSKLKERGVVIKPRTSAMALGLYQTEKIYSDEE